jgi:hypothetical protein
MWPKMDRSTILVFRWVPRCVASVKYPTTEWANKALIYPLTTN